MSLLNSLKSMFTPAPRVDPAAAAARIRAGDALLVDVRESREWSGGVALHAKLLPLSDLTGGRSQWRDFLAAVGEREVLLYCASGMRSGSAARLLAAEGIRAANSGGLSDWAAAGWPIVAPGKRK
ncbi:MAG TPA: rhodanese-like domain-containing protein [Opitutaceae bacterium]|nr:rhodanese-like domain-containing protein [Opitutaceae bacterium]